jgi:aspartyl-tRNA synthetase
MDYTDVMEILEYLVVEVYKYTLEKCKKEQDAIGIKINVPHTPFERITYLQALDELKSAGENLKFGDDLLDSHLRIIGKNHPGFFFLIDWPMKLKPFYIREKDDDPKISRSFDLQYGYLELSSGGTRLHDSKKIVERLKEQGLDPAQFAKHLQAFDWGMPPHAGWGLGLERLLTTLIGIDNVREVVLYPRDPDRLTP